MCTEHPEFGSPADRRRALGCLPSRRALGRRWPRCLPGQSRLVGDCRLGSPLTLFHLPVFVHTTKSVAGCVFSARTPSGNAVSALLVLRGVDVLNLGTSARGMACARRNLICRHSFTESRKSASRCSHHLCRVPPTTAHPRTHAFGADFGTPTSTSCMASPGVPLVRTRFARVVLAPGLGGDLGAGFILILREALQA